MAFDERHIGGITLFDLKGRLTYSAGSELSTRIGARCLSPPTHVVLNLETVSYIDSAGLGAIVEAFTAVRHCGGELKLLNPTTRTRHLLEVTGLAQIVATFDAEDEALASFAGAVSPGPDVPADERGNGWSAASTDRVLSETGLECDDVAKVI